MAKFCGNCGASLNDSTSRCPRCGAVLNSAHSKDTTDQRPKKRKKKKGLIVFTSFVCLCLIALIVVTSMVRNDKIDDVVSDLEQAENVLKPAPKAPDLSALYQQYSDFDKTGVCGNNVQWKISADGLLAIVRGQGEIPEGTIFQGINEEETKRLKYIIVEEGITRINKDNFYILHALETLYLPSTVSKIDSESFVFCQQLVNLIFPNGNDYFSVEKSVLFSSDKTQLIKYLGGKKGSSYTVPKEVRIILNNAFHDTSFLAKVVVPETVEQIQKNAFQSSHSIEEVVLPDSILLPEGLSFSWCESLRSVHLPSTMTEISDYMFWACASLESFEIHDGVTQIGYLAFSSCKKLKEVKIPNTVVTICGLAFEDCESLKEIELPQSLEYLGRKNGMETNARIFSGCTSIKSIVIPSSVNISASYLFKGWVPEQTVYFRDSAPSPEWEDDWAEKCDAKIVWGYTG